MIRANEDGIYICNAQEFGCDFETTNIFELLDHHEELE
jgi:hypothetical protein